MKFAGSEQLYGDGDNDERNDLSALEGQDNFQLILMGGKIFGNKKEAYGDQGILEQDFQFMVYFHNCA